MLNGIEILGGRNNSESGRRQKKDGCSNTFHVMFDRCRTDFADIQNKKECGGNRQWQNHYLRNWAANTKGKGII